MKLKETREGGTIVYESIADLKEKRMVVLIFSFWIAIALLIFSIAASTDFELEGEFLMIALAFGIISPLSFVGAILLMYKSSYKRIELLLGDNILKINGEDHVLTKDSALRIHRHRYTVKSSSSSNSSKVTDWELILDQSGEKIKILKSRSYHSDDLWIPQLAENIAETMELTLYDDSGLEPIIRHVGKTDLNLREYLREKDVKPLNSFYLPDNIMFNHGKSGYTLTVQPGMGNLYMIIPLLFVVPSLAIGIFFLVYDFSGDQTFLYIPIGISVVVFGVLFLFVVNSFNAPMRFGFERNVIKVTKLGKLVKSRAAELNIDEFEYMIPTKMWTYFTVEFVGDNQRFSIPGRYSQEEAMQLCEILESAIRSYCI